MNRAISLFICSVTYAVKILMTSENGLISKHTAQSAAYYKEFRGLKNLTEKLKTRYEQYKIALIRVNSRPHIF